MHHVRQNLPLTDLSLAVQLFAKNIDDESLPSSIQTMSCKLLLNLVDCIRSKSEQENGNGRDILMRMLEVRQGEGPLSVMRDFAGPGGGVSQLLWEGLTAGGGNRGEELTWGRDFGATLSLS